MQPLAIFRCDASTVIGGGHVRRCLTLADALAELGWRCAFACRKGSAEVVPALDRTGHEVFEIIDSPEAEPAALATRWPGGCDLLVVDHYGRDVAFETACRPWARRILVIDDLANRSHACDVLIDGAEEDGARYGGLVPPGTQLLLGSNYALLRPEFRALRERSMDRRAKTGPLRRVLVSFGAIDKHHMTALALDAVARSGVETAVDVVLGGRAPHLPEIERQLTASGLDTTLHVEANDMAELMSKADLAVGSGGTTALERCCLGLPTVLVVTADNQQALAEHLARRGAVVYVADWRMAVVERTAAEVRRLNDHPIERRAMSQAAQGLCDGLGARRTAKVLEQVTPGAAHDSTMDGRTAHAVRS